MRALPVSFKQLLPTGVPLAAAVLVLLSMPGHFADGDDVRVIKTILDSRQAGYFQARLLDKKSPTHDTKPKLILRQLLERQPGLAGPLDVVARVFAVPMSWTFAPAQYWLADALIPSDGNYRSKLFWGRFPSWFAFSLGLALWWVILARIYRPGSVWVTCLGTALLGFSLENQIYGQLTASYAVVVPLMATVFLLMLNERPDARRSSWRTGLVLGAMVYAQYQMAFVGTAFLMSRVWSDVVEPGTWSRTSIVEAWRRRWAAGATFAAIAAPAMLYIVIKRFTAISWNAGPQDRFRFVADRLRSDPLYFFEFFGQNAYLTTTRMVAFVAEDGVWASVAFPVVFGLSLCGLGRLSTAKEGPRQQIFRFMVALALVWTALVVLGKLALSPTRHNLILLPVIAVAVVEGLHWVTAWVRRLLPMDNPAAAVFGTATALILAGYWSAYPSFYEARRDPFREDEFKQVVKEWPVEHIYDYGAGNLDLMQLGGRVDVSRLREGEQLDQVVTGMGGSAPIAVVGKNMAIADSHWQAGYQALLGGGWCELVRREEQTDIPLEFSSLTVNGSRSLFLYLLSPPGTADCSGAR